jgi:hypothetical protein
MKSMQDYINEHDVPRFCVLPLVHTTDYSTFIDHIADEGLKAFYNKDIKKKAVFFYYGKTAYISREDFKTQLDDEFAPISIVLEAISIPPNEVHIMDTGSYNMTSDKYLRGCSLDMYELNPSYDDVKKFIKFFYGSNIRYIEADRDKSLPGNMNGHEDTPLRNYCDLFDAFVHEYYSSLEQKLDQRVCTIEIVLEHDLSFIDMINSNMKLCVPRRKMTEILKKYPSINKENLLPYNSSIGTPGYGRVYQIQSMLQDHYELSGLLRDHIEN